MSFKALTNTLSVAPQLAPSDIVVAATAGFKAIINNRPDGEEPGQPTSAELAHAAQAAGVAYHHIPVIAGQISDEAVDEFGQAMAASDGPVLAFCRTGMRAATLWALSQASQLPVGGLLRTAAQAGYDLTAITPRLLKISMPAAGQRTTP